MAQYSTRPELEAAYLCGMADYAAGARMVSGNPITQALADRIAAHGDHTLQAMHDAWRCGWSAAHEAIVGDLDNGDDLDADPAPVAQHGRI